MTAWWNPLAPSKKAGKPKKKAAPKARRKVAAGAAKKGMKTARKPAKASAKQKPAARGTKRAGAKSAAKAASKRKPAARSGGKKPATTGMKSLLVVDAAKRAGAAMKKGSSGAAKPAARRGKAGRERVQLRWIAQARSGDKGDIANIALFAPTEEMYEIFCREVTARRVKAHFSDFVKGKIDRYEAPNVRALNFVAHASLGGGGASSLRSDPLGKSYGSNLLRMEIEVPADVLARTPKWKSPKTLPDV